MNKYNLGKYQNDILDLPKLQPARYENIFRMYEDNSSGFWYYNIFKSIQMPDDLDATLYELYTIDRDIPLPVLSYNLYGTTTLWWLILCTNKIMNPVKSLPAGHTIKIIKKDRVKDVLNELQKVLKQ